MRPTFSIIFFTVASGAGYGLWFLIGLGILMFGSGLPLPLHFTLTVCGLVVGFLLVSSGLLSSLGHLGKPQRAWRALSQWRSSWLSREGIVALLTYVPAAGIAAAALGHWPDTPFLQILGALLAAGALLTVYCTANIYACLKPVRAWHNGYVAVGYLLLSVYSGALWWMALLTVPEESPRTTWPLFAGLLISATLCAILKIAYWRFVDRESTTTTGDATGLNSLGSVRSFERPHTEENYLTHEMGFRIARKHSRKLRLIALIAGFLLPALLTALGLAIPSLGVLAAWLALALGMGGLFVERWLFFAEAKHVVMLYYGARSS